jgi:Ni/Co efflux regulator RcnB
MKQIIAAAVALSLVGGGVAGAKPHDKHDKHFKHDGYGRHDNGKHKGWYKGERLPAYYRTDRYIVEDWRAARLRPPPRGYYWVEAEPHNYVLAAIATGIILEVLTR